MTDTRTERATLFRRLPRCQADARARAHTRVAALAFIALLFLPRSLAAQDSRPAVTDSCAAGRITRVLIDNTSIFDAEDPELDGRLRWAYRAANALHVRTREAVLRRELLFRIGDCYDPFLLAESERLLRAYDFLTRAEVAGTRNADGDWQVSVNTQDDWSTRVDVRLRVDEGLQLEGISLNEENLIGTGQRLGAFFFEREVTREYGLSYFTPQLFGTRWDLAAAAGRTRPGTFVREEIAYPFVGEVSRWAGRQSFQRNDRFFNYIVNDDPAGDAAHILIPLREKFFDLAVVRRIGARGNMALVGAGLSYQQLAYPGVPERAPAGDFDHRVPADSAEAAAVAPQMDEISNIRLSLLLGHRNVWWVERRGLESMRGLQDIKLGAEAGLVLGRSLPSLEADNDLFVTFTLYTGMANDNLLVVGRARADVRRDLEAPAGVAEWEDLYGDGELLGYWHLDAQARHTVFVRAAGIGAWNTRTPFQLTLGGERGVRGYYSERFPGGRRAVFTLEHRMYLGWPFGQLLDLGTTVFADVGRVWPGGTPFGADSGWRSAAGFGLRGAFPAGSRTTYRIDLAWPLERGVGFGDFRVRFSIGEPFGLHSNQGDLQLLRSRPEGVGGRMFQFRN